MSRPSKWEFLTSNGGSVSAGIASAEGGSITLLSPQAPGAKWSSIMVH